MFAFILVALYIYINTMLVTCDQDWAMGWKNLIRTGDVRRTEGQTDRLIAEASKCVSSVRKSEVASEILKDEHVYRKQIKPYGTPGLTSLSPFWKNKAQLNSFNTKCSQHVGETSWRIFAKSWTILRIPLCLYKRR